MIEKMSPWSITSLETVDLDDSSSAGNRMGAKRRSSDDNLFEIVPKFLINHACAIEPDYQPVPKRVFATATGGDTIGIVVDTELLILEKGAEPEISKKVSFTSAIDFVLWRRSILLVGLSSSEIVLVDPRTYEIKESKKLSPNTPVDGDERFFTDAAVHSNPDPSKIDVIVVAKSGIVYVFHNIALSDGTLDSTHDQNISVDVDVGSIRGTRVQCLGDTATNVLCASSPSRNIVVLGEENGSLSLHDIENGEPKTFKASQAINIAHDLEVDHVSLKKVVYCEGLLFVLLSDGTLSILLDGVYFATEEFELPEKSYIIHDFALVLTAHYDVKLWVVYGNPDANADNTFIGIFAGPSFKPEFVVKIPSTPEANKQNDSSRLSTFQFPSQATPFEEPFAFLQLSSSSTKVYQMAETSTDASLHNLILRGKYDQALALAEQYGKDLDVVFKAKARAKFNEIMTIKDIKVSKKASTAFEVMIETLEKVQDATFVCDFCSQRGLPELQWTKNLMGLGKNRVKDCSGTKEGKDLLLKLKKFYTFEQVYPGGTLQEWMAFSSEENSMFQHCVWFLSKHEFDKCERVWRRHYDEFILEINLNSFGAFFITLFGKRLNSPEAVSLFKCIFPFAVQKCAENNCPQSMAGNMELSDTQLSKVNTLVDIVRRQICSLEREKGWPKEASEFSKIVISVVNEEIQNLDNMRNPHDPKIVIQSTICREILHRMELMLQNLIELADLKQNHSIRIPFLQYFEDDVIEVVNSMLYELFHRDEVEVFINKFLIPFAQRKGIEVDRLFHEHVKAVVSDLPFHMNSFDIPHEERLICLVMHINSPEIKLRSVLKIAEEWPVPWSPGVDNLVVTCLRMNFYGDSICNDLQQTINIMRVQVPFRCLLTKYRLSATRVQSYCGVSIALNRILKMGKPDEYYQDCLELIRHTGRVDEVKIQSLGFSLKLQDVECKTDTLVSSKMDTRLLKRLLARTLQEFRMGELLMMKTEEIKRITDLCKILANILDDKKAIEFLKLRELIPTLNNCDIVYDERYPLCVLNNIMSEYSEKSSSILIQQCKKLGDITYTHFPDILITAAAFYARRNGSNDLQKTWDIIEAVVNTPGCYIGKAGTNRITSSLVQGAAFDLVQFLICHCPYSTDSQLGILHDLIIIMTQFDENTEEIAKMLGSFRIFWGLREQEIPLEQDFLTIYRWMYVQGLPVGQKDIFFKFLRGFGTTILKFGDKDLFRQAFGCIKKEFLSRATVLIGRSEEQTASRLYAKRIVDVQNDLYGSSESLAEPETDKNVIDLVEDLKKGVGMSVTPYALRKRNKSRLLEKLLGMNEHSVAAQVALVFEVFSDCNAWSKILQGFMNSRDLAGLRKVLMDLRNVSELWMLSEFADAWRMVSEVQKDFQNLCPIPLD